MKDLKTHLEQYRLGNLPLPTYNELTGYLAQMEENNKSPDASANSSDKLPEVSKKNTP